MGNEKKVTKVKLLKAVIVGNEIKDKGETVSISILEKFGINVDNLKARGLVK